MGSWLFIKTQVPSSGRAIMGDGDMKTLLMGTTNPAKLSQMRDVFSLFGVTVEGVKDKTLLPYVEEDGLSVEQNARKKACAYARFFDRPVLSVDNGLFFDGLPDEQQPGIYVRRIGGKEAVTDEELRLHGIELVRSLGDRAGAYWLYGVCVSTSDGRTAETVVKTPRIFVSEPSTQKIPGYPLESIQIDPESGKYISEMSENEKTTFWQRTIGTPIESFVRRVLNEGLLD